MRIFSARRVWGFSSETLRGFELEKYYRRSAILTPTLGNWYQLKKSNKYNYVLCVFPFLLLFISHSNRATWYQIKAEGKPVNLL